MPANYAGCSGSGRASGVLTDADGVFYLGSKINMKHITDGASHTAAFSERSLGPGDAETKRHEDLILELPPSADPTESACQSESSGQWNPERCREYDSHTLYHRAILLGR